MCKKGDPPSRGADLATGGGTVRWGWAPVLQGAPPGPSGSKGCSQREETQGQG